MKFVNIFNGRRECSSKRTKDTFCNSRQGAEFSIRVLEILAVRQIRPNRLGESAGAATNVDVVLPQARLFRAQSSVAGTKLTQRERVLESAAGVV